MLEVVARLLRFYTLLLLLDAPCRYNQLVSRTFEL